MSDTVDISSLLKSGDVPAWEAVQWDGNIPRRRYALFKSESGSLCMRVIREDDIERAEKWQGFVSWYGKERKRETRDISRNTADI